MTTIHPFIEPNYIRTPRLTLPGTIALADALIAQASSTPTPKEEEARDALSEQVETAREALAMRERHLSDEPDDTRLVDNAADSAWTALYGALSAHAQLPEDRFPAAGLAKKLRATIFPQDSLDFLRLRYLDQYGLMTARVHRMREDGLVPRLIELVGESFWKEIQHTLERYTEMVQDGMDTPPDNEDLGAALRSLRLRIADYALKVASEARIDDPASVNEARDRLSAMLAAKEVARRTQRSRGNANQGNGGSTEPEPEPPTPATATEQEPERHQPGSGPSVA